MSRPGQICTRRALPVRWLMWLLLLGAWTAALRVEAGRPAAQTLPATQMVSPLPVAQMVSPLPVAQMVSPLPSAQLRFETLSLEDGLSENAVLDVLQDSRGFVWFATRDGLNKYDGYTFTIYRHDLDAPETLSDDFVTALFEDSRGILWVGTFNGGLNRLDRQAETFSHYRRDPADPASLADDTIWDIVEDDLGRLWVATESGGLARLTVGADGSILMASFRHRPEDPASLSSDGVSALAVDNDGHLWAATDAGLDVYDPDRNGFEHYRHAAGDSTSLGSDDVLSLLVDGQGRLWAGTDAGLSRFYPGTGGFWNHAHDPRRLDGLASGPVSAIAEDGDGVLWLGTAGTVGGLTTFEPQTSRFQQHGHSEADPYSLVSNDVRAIQIDRAGIVWIGTFGGVSKHNPATRAFAHYDHDPTANISLSHDDVTALLEDDRGVVWIGTRGGGLDRFNPADGNFTQFQAISQHPYSLSDNNVWAIFEDSAGTLWVGTERGGLNWFDPETERFSHYRHDPADPVSLSNDTVRALAEDKAGRLWIGTHGGLNVLDRSSKAFTAYRHDPARSDSLSDDVILAILPAGDGTLWVGTERGGLNRFDPAMGTAVRYGQRWPELRATGMAALYQDGQGALWVGSQTGLYRLEPDGSAPVAYTEANGLANDWIHGILPGDGGQLWLSTNRGLSCLDTDSGLVKNYDADSGLQSASFNTGAYALGRDGALYFGGANGFNVFYPDQLQDSQQAPPVVITALSKFNTLFVNEPTSGQAVELSYQENFLSFDYASLDYAAPDRNEYAYMMTGLDEDWVFAGPRRHVDYPDLAPGDYVFRVRGSNSDGVWNEAGAALAIHIQPPFWQTDWFRALGLLLVVAAVAGAYTWRVGTIEARNRELARQVAERTAEIERSRRELEALYHADEELHRSLDLARVLQALMDVAAGILEADKSSLIVWDEERRRLQVQVARDFRPETVAQMTFGPGEGSVGRVAISGEMAVVEDTQAAQDLAWDIIEAEGIRAFMHVPITIGGQIFGVFNVDYLTPRGFSTTERRLFASLAQRAAVAIENARLYERAQDVAVLEERRRLARDLHDSVTQSLYSLTLLAAAGQRLLEQGNLARAGAHLGRLGAIAQEALKEMRLLVYQLRPLDLGAEGLAGALQQRLEAVERRAGVNAYLKVEGAPDLPGRVERQLFYIAQEALNNALKHAEASQVEIGLRAEGQRLVLEVRDDGRGFDLVAAADTGGLGLSTMRERAEDLGGRLSVQSPPGAGTLVRVEAPLAPPLATVGHSEHTNNLPPGEKESSG